MLGGFYVRPVFEVYLQVGSIYDAMCTRLVFVQGLSINVKYNMPFSVQVVFLNLVVP